MAGLSDRFRGDTIRIPLTIKNKTTGVAIDITGATIWMTIKQNKSDDDVDALAQVSVTVHIDAGNGQSEIVVPSATTDTFPLGKVFYDIQLVDAGGDVTTLLSGDFKVLEDITRST